MSSEKIYGTIDQIKALMREAAAAGDLKQVVYCEIALSIRDTSSDETWINARRMCEAVLLDAKAQS